MMLIEKGHKVIDSLCQVGIVLEVTDSGSVRTEQVKEYGCKVFNTYDNSDMLAYVPNFIINLPIRGALYNHFKGGVYQVIGISIPLIGKKYFEKKRLAKKLISVLHTETTDDIRLAQCLDKYYHLCNWKECNTPLVLYRSTTNTDLLFARPLVSFTDEVLIGDYPNINKVFRFTKI